MNEKDINDSYGFVSFESYAGFTEGRSLRLNVLKKRLNK